VVVALFMTLNRLRNRTGMLATLQFFQAAGLIAGVAALYRPLGLDSVGWVTLGVEIVLAAAVVPSVYRWLRGTPAVPETPEPDERPTQPIH